MSMTVTLPGRSVDSTVYPDQVAAASLTVVPVGKTLGAASVGARHETRRSKIAAIGERQRR